MNVYKNTQNIILAVIISLLTACAKEGPYVAGKLECEFSPSYITPTSAIVSVSIPQNSENVLTEFIDNYYSICLSDKKFDGANPIDWYSLENSYICYGHRFLFRNLKPNTTYYPLVRSKSSLNDGSTEVYYNSGFSFTTAPTSYYTDKLNEISCEVVFSALDRARIKIKLPSDLYMYSYGMSDPRIKVYGSPDMKDGQSYDIVGYSDPDKCYADIKIPENGICYFKIISGFRLYNLYDGNLEYEWDNKEVNVKIKDPIDLSGQNSNDISCEALSSVLGYARIKINLPSDLSMYAYGYYYEPRIIVSGSPDMKDGQSYNIVGYADPDQCYADIKIPENGKCYVEVISYFRFKNTIVNWDLGELSVKIKDPIVIPEESQFTCSLLDYKAKIGDKYFTVVKVKTPSNVKIRDYAYGDSHDGHYTNMTAFSITNSETEQKAYTNNRYQYPYNDLSIYDLEADEYVFIFPVLKKEKYRLRLNCCVEAFLGNSPMVFDDITINIDNILDLTNVSDN
ncbi:MAG: hypothetical protein K2N35_10235 [Muribaculaceae bacterium]|nr:hypothetical protein [Muribaculaceae bacterium]